MPHPPALTPASEAVLVEAMLHMWLHGMPSDRPLKIVFPQISDRMTRVLLVVRQHDATAAQARLDALLSAYDAAPGVAEGASDAGTVEALREALLRARAFIKGPGDREGPVLRQIDAALAATEVRS